MNAWLRVALIGAISVLAFDTLLSLASTALGFSYANGSFGSWLIYGAVGFFAARATGQIRHSAAAAALVGATDASLGWWISSLLGPGKLPGTVPESTTIPVIIFAVCFAVITATVIGSLGGLLARVTATPDPAGPTA